MRRRQLHGFRRLLTPALAVALVGACNGEPLGPADECEVVRDGFCWKQLGLDGYWITALLVIDDDLYVGTADAGVFNQHREGMTWQQLGLDHATISSLAPVGEVPQRILAGVKPSVLGTTPSGEEQTPEAMFVSEDGGATWSVSDGGLAARHDNRYWAYSLLANRTTQGMVYMGGEGVVFRSADKGRTWDQVLGDSEAPSAAWLRSVGVSPHDDDRVWVGGHTGRLQPVVYRSPDGGGTWTHVNPTPGQENAVFAVVPDPHEPGRVWAGSEGGVLRSDDGGDTWGYSLSHEDAALVQAVLFVGNELWAGSHRHGVDGALFRSKDGGSTWEQVQIPPFAAGIRSLAIDRDGSLLVGTTGSGVWSVEW